MKRPQGTAAIGTAIPAGLPPGAPRPEHTALPVTAGLLARRSQSIAMPSQPLSFRGQWHKVGVDSLLTVAGAATG